MLSGGRHEGNTEDSYDAHPLHFADPSTTLLYWLLVGPRVISMGGGARDLLSTLRASILRIPDVEPNEGREGDVGRNDSSVGNSGSALDVTLEWPSVVYGDMRKLFATRSGIVASCPPGKYSDQ